MKKIAMLIATTMYSCTAFAVNGPYLGARLGYSNTIFKVDAVAIANFYDPIAGHYTKVHEKDQTKRN